MCSVKKKELLYHTNKTSWYGTLPVTQIKLNKIQHNRRLVWQTLMMCTMMALRRSQFPKSFQFEEKIAKKVKFVSSAWNHLPIRPGGELNMKIMKILRSRSLCSITKSYKLLLRLTTPVYWTFWKMTKKWNLRFGFHKRRFDEEVKYH